MSEDIPPPVNLDAVAKRDFKYYIFDWDNNILHMPTKIHLEQRGEDGTWSHIEVPTSMFAMIRSDTENYRPPNGDWESAFVEFRDFEQHSESTFLADTRAALDPVIRGEEGGAPSYHILKKAIVEGRLFAIVTARGHAPATIRKGVEYFIEHALSEAERSTMLGNLRGYIALFGEDSQPRSDLEVLDYYLGLNKYHGVTSPHFQNLLDTNPGPDTQREAKQVAIKDFVEHVIGIIRNAGIDNKPVSFGFSDDDMSNIKAVEDYITRRLAREFPGVKFVIYDTSDPGRPKGRKIVVQGQLELDL